ncbi:MAG: hypothetical protein HF314_10055 [Ignavibacteria bacterium]|jgi:hypothetical protein|nr:hypothetical protein [Ignavibacteria bacterium]MCU7503408.1 hypothetical protein [Ignavibacteria bacterium]MCU7516260.1 hypothetical protein [Ignavibacteria bacterium]
MNNTFFHKILYSAFMLFLLLETAGAYQEKPDTIRAEDLFRDSITISSINNKEVIESVKKFSEKENFFSRLLRHVLVAEEEDPRSRNSTGALYRNYSGKIIRNIDVRVLDVFGTSVDHPDDSATSWLQQTGNAVHLNTRAWLVKNRLLFSEGSRLVPYEVAESERLLRQNDFIYDSKILVSRVKNSRDSVDVLVLVQDVWSITGGASYQPQDKTGKVSFKDINFLGFGNEITGAVKFDNAYQGGWTWDGSYTFSNIDRTYISASVYHFSENDNKRYGFNFNRDFFSPVTRYAGGFGMQWSNDRVALLNDTLQTRRDVRYNRQHYWLGYAFDLKPFDPYSVNFNRFNVSLRIDRTQYTATPKTEDSGLFQDNTFYLGRLGYSYRTYYRDRYLFGLGKIEDIPLGNLAELLLGYEKGQYANRPYLGFKTGYSNYSDDFGYLYGGFQVGGYRQNDAWTNGVMVLESLYYSRLLPIGNFKWRHYLGTRYSYSYNPVTAEDLLDINGDMGLRGFNSEERGNKKLVLNYENDIFLPLKFLNFKLAFITFADFALLSGKNELLFSSKFYQGYGFGFRIRNEHLIFPNFQLMFAYFPNDGIAGGNRIEVFRQQSMFYHFNQFQISAPSVVQF